ncbi:MAG: hypothetical protein HQK51_17490 [Oligoflexia bacterium]|nr:hypothetical protein [Oligoflexia bacterium]
MSKKQKTIIKYSLLLFVFISLSFAVYKELKNSTPQNITAEKNNETIPSSAPVIENSDKTKTVENTNSNLVLNNTEKISKDISKDKEDKKNVLKKAAIKGIKAADKKIIAYYFHGNARCTSCLQIEKLSKGTIETKFADELNKGIIEWHTVNVEESNNVHFVKDYKLYTKSVILSFHKKGKEKKWKNLDKVWEYLRDEKKFETYIQGEVNNYLGEFKL